MNTYNSKAKAKIMVWRGKNPVKYKLYQKRYHKKWYRENAEDVKIYVKHWRQQSPEKNRMYWRKYLAKNHDRVMEIQRKYRAKHKDKLNARARERRRIRAAAEGRIIRPYYRPIKEQTQTQTNT